MTNGFVQLNHDSQDDYKGTRDEAMAKGQELFEEHESRIDENNNDECAKVVQAKSFAQSTRS